MSGCTVTTTMNIEAEFVKPRDLVAVRGLKAASVNNTEEFHTVVRFDDGTKLRVWKGSVVTVYRDRSKR